MRKNFNKLTRLSNLLLLLTLFLNVNGKPIDMAAAKQIAMHNMAKMRKSRAASQTPKDTDASISLEMVGDEQTFYVFNIGTDDGFIVVSGDDATEEILMSCESGHFQADNMPENMMGWLRGYSKQIRMLREMGATREENKRKADAFDLSYKLEDDPDKAERLAKWAQSGFFGSGTENKHELYNYGLPIVKEEGETDKTASTGCTITAVSQVLYYHQWPKKIGPKSIPEYTSTTHKFKRSGYDEGTQIDWGNIKRTYSSSDTYSQKEIAAISNLMGMVGTAFKTNYKYTGSSASLSNTPSVLTQYFGFEDMEYCNKFKDEDKWLKKIYDELTTNGPVLYRGEEGEASHSFVIEGIEGNYVWVNWGWGNSYKTSTKTLLSTCEGGGYSFSDGQAAVFNLKPDKDGHYRDMVLRLATSALISNISSYLLRQSEEADFEDIPIQYSVTNIFDDTIFDIGFLIENTATGEENYYSLFSRSMKQFKTTTLNLKFSFGKNLGDGVYRLYGASRENGTDSFHPNYSKSSEYIEFTISGNKLYLGNNLDKTKETLLCYTSAMGTEYRLYGQTNYSETRANPDGVVFIRTDLLLDVRKNGTTKTYVVDRGNIFNSATYENMMYPCMMLDIEHDRMYVFQNSKDDDEYYGMKGYMFTSPISSINFTREVIYEHFNCGWFPYFLGVASDGTPALHHFSFAGYYEMLTLVEDDEWATYFVSQMDPQDAEKDGKSHSPFLVVGEDRVNDKNVEYCNSEQDDDGYKVLSVSPDVSGNFTIPETVEDSPVSGIASYAFSTCDDITSITIPASITSIDEYAFGSSKNLKSIRVVSPVPIDLSYTLDEGESGEGGSSAKHYVMTPFELVDKANCVLYVPRGSKKDYALAVGWGDFEHIEEYGYPGDANDDHEVNITDVMVIVDYILGREITNFIFLNSDLDKDGSVNITDALKVVDIILGRN